jgi:FtsP/CotA-like multicopper oxidase with cupredoxin domain
MGACPEIDHPPLQHIESVDARGIPIEMVFGARPMQTHSSAPFFGRGWAGGIPGPMGPVIRIRPGDWLNVTLKNELQGPNPDCDITGSYICYLNSTNFHTHGLHVSGKLGQDHVFTTAGPGETLELHIKLPDNHMGGMHWYHPHGHHSTSVQAGMGAAGVIIVEDPEGSIPGEIRDMPEHIMVLAMLNMPTLMKLLRQGHDQLVQTDDVSNYVYVNGQVEPEKTVGHGQWNRFRLLFAAVQQTIRLVPQSDDASCEMQLLAKDGIYLTEFPRTVETISMFPGARSDFAIRCQCHDTSQTECSVRFVSLDPDQADTEGNAGTAVWQGGVFEVKISGAYAESPALTTTRVQRPCYLVDLQNVPASDLDAHAMTMDQLKLGWDDKKPYKMGHMMKPSWQGALGNVSGGSVVEIAIRGSTSHPFHLHVNHFSVMNWRNVPAAWSNGDYYLPGDWHDTMYSASSSMSDEGTRVRFQTDQFAGPQVLHCHFLEHEDKGMMGYLWITGPEGQEWSGARVIDPDCIE